MKKSINKEELSEDYCFICKDGGAIRICDYGDCLKSYHASCVGKDDSFLDSKERWSCSWHSCSCRKSATFRCFCCPTSFCRACIRNAEFGSAKGKTKGFCNMCLKLATMIEENKDTDSDGNKADFEDTGTYEFLFKDYWEIIKEQEGLTLIDLHASAARLKNGENLNIESDSDKFSEDELLSEEDDMVEILKGGVLRLDDRKIRKERTKRKPQWSRMKKKNFVGWGSEVLVQFLKSIDEYSEQPLTQLNVCDIVKHYAMKNNLVDHKKKKKVHCDERLHALFRKKSVNIYKMYHLLESHLAESQESDEESSSGHEYGTIAKRRRKETPDSCNGRKQVSQPPKDCCPAIIGRNIQSAYLKRSLVIEILKNPKTLAYKIVGCFVRVKNDPKDFYCTPRKAYQLGQVLGVKNAKEEYKLGETNIDIVLQVSNMFKDIPLYMLSDDDFEEKECQDLRLLVQRGLMKWPTVAELKKTVGIIHADIVNHWIDKEIIKLQKQIDQANEKGWRRELFEYMERRDLLRKPAERLRLLDDIPEVIAEQEDVRKQLNFNENKKCSCNEEGTPGVTPHSKLVSIVQGDGEDSFLAGAPDLAGASLPRPRQRLRLRLRPRSPPTGPPISSSALDLDRQPLDLLRPRSPPPTAFPTTFSSNLDRLLLRPRQPLTSSTSDSSPNHLCPLAIGPPLDANGSAPLQTPSPRAPDLLRRICPAPNSIPRPAPTPTFSRPARSLRPRLPPLRLRPPISASSPSGSASSSGSTPAPPSPVPRLSESLLPPDLATPPVSASTTGSALIAVSSPSSSPPPFSAAMSCSPHHSPSHSSSPPPSSPSHSSPSSTSPPPVEDLLRRLQLSEAEATVFSASSAHRSDLREFGFSLVGTLLSGGSFHFPAFRAVIVRNWPLIGDCSVVELRPNLFSFKFTVEADLLRVLRDGPWSFEGKMLLLRRRERQDTPTNIRFSHMPIWVQIHDVPLGWLSASTGRLLGSSIGHVSEVEVPDLGEVAPIIRVRVDLPVNEPLRRGALLQTEDEAVVWCFFRYERLQKFCNFCGMIGTTPPHSCGGGLISGLPPFPSCLRLMADALAGPVALPPLPVPATQSLTARLHPRSALDGSRPLAR